MWAARQAVAEEADHRVGLQFDRGPVVCAADAPPTVEGAAHYIAPTEASTREFELVEILHDGGEGYWAVARAATGVLGVRWNGSGERLIGFPSSHGKAVWFIVPDSDSGGRCGPGAAMPVACLPV